MGRDAEYFNDVTANANAREELSVTSASSHFRGKSDVQWRACGHSASRRTVIGQQDPWPLDDNTGLEAFRLAYLFSQRRQ
ncbi:hypothetical protein PsYK624_120460 [Phanerochaete sordida]|uniref:Uncharacterized protein n=1 Tax=Phanerochaete sordida TaxID=48140 RepID=A0A9P3GIR2_9APHY|nr:hypothetical protein PsYK624_120460 [Phanerochaete sordida]